MCLGDALDDGEAEAGSYVVGVFDREHHGVGVDAGDADPHGDAASFCEGKERFGGFFSDEEGADVSSGDVFFGEGLPVGTAEEEQRWSAMPPEHDAALAEPGV